VRIGWLGLGRLGLPCALVLAQHHDVFGYDVSERPWDILAGTIAPMREEGIEKLLADGQHRIQRCGGITGVVQQSDIIFVAVQTPHSPEFGGEKPMISDECADFEYSFLVQACRDVARAADHQYKHVTLVVVSTVLPGTTDRLIRPVLNSFVSLIYSPQFIAMGTTIADFINPEFVICGCDISSAPVSILSDVFVPVHGADKRFCCDIVTAESIKMLYNSYVSMKIVWANHVMEMCHKLGSNCDAVVDALSLATDRVISLKYMRGGMGDGGACHPRDLVALSWLEDQLDMSAPLFWSTVSAREWQTEWLADIVRHYASLTGLQVVIFGMAYKPGSDLTDGSSALLLAEYLKDLQPEQYDPYVPQSVQHLQGANMQPWVYVIATKHPEFGTHRFWPGSVVVDPFGYIQDQEDVTVIRIGRH